MRVHCVAWTLYINVIIAVMGFIIVIINIQEQNIVDKQTQTVSLSGKLKFKNN